MGNSMNIFFSFIQLNRCNALAHPKCVIWTRGMQTKWIFLKRLQQLKKTNTRDLCKGSRDPCDKYVVSSHACSSRRTSLKYTYRAYCFPSSSSLCLTSKCWACEFHFVRLWGHADASKHVAIVNNVTGKSALFVVSISVVLKYGISVDSVTEEPPPFVVFFLIPDSFAPRRAIVLIFQYLRMQEYRVAVRESAIINSSIFVGIRLDGG